MHVYERITSFTGGIPCTSGALPARRGPNVVVVYSKSSYFFEPVSPLRPQRDEEMACFRSPDVDVSGSQERRLLTDQVQTDRQVVVRQGGAEECRLDASRRGDRIGMTPLWYAYVCLSATSCEFSKKKKKNVSIYETAISVIVREQNTSGALRRQFCAAIF